MYSTVNYVYMGMHWGRGPKRWGYTILCVSNGDNKSSILSHITSDGIALKFIDVDGFLLRGVLFGGLTSDC